MIPTNITVFDNKTLTTAYSGNAKEFSTYGMEKMVLYVNYTTGAAETNNSIEIKVEFTPDNAAFYQETNAADSGGTTTLTQKEYTFVGASAATSYKFSVPIELADNVVKVSIKETGVAANAGTATVLATLSANAGR
jgi:hypothetical protein